MSIYGHEPPAELDAASGNRPWYKQVCPSRGARAFTALEADPVELVQNSLVLLPSTHPLHEDARRAGKHQKKFGNVYRASAFLFSVALRSSYARVACSLCCWRASSAAADDESRPTHLLHASLPKVQEFIASKVPRDALLRRPADLSSGEAEAGGAGGGGAADSGDRNGVSAEGEALAAAADGDVVMNGASAGKA